MLYKTSRGQIFIHSLRTSSKLDPSIELGKGEGIKGIFDGIIGKKQI